MIFPQTLVRLVIGCFLLTAVPLCIALGQLALNINDLALRSQLAVKRAESVGAVSRELRDAALSMERGIRQALVLDDAGLLEDYARTRQTFTAVLTRADALPLEQREKTSIEGLRKQDTELAASLSKGIPAVTERASVAENAAKLSDRADQVVIELDRVVAREITELESQAVKGRADWPWLVGVAALFALVLGLGSALLVARPLRSLDASIRRMGEARFDTPVTIKGPQDVRSLGERLEWLRKRLHDLESHQANFLRQVSHELKTPLTAIREGSELLNDRVTGELTADQEEVVRIIRDNSLQLQKLITDLLNYQSHRSAIPLKREPVAIADVVQLVVDSHRVPILAKAISTRVHVVPITFVADRERLRVVVDNLLSNAIKFSPKGGQIFIAARMTAGAFQIDVSDQGPGVAEVDKERIFDSFYQGATPPDSNVKGTGLGLAIAREFVLAHGGELSLIEPGKPGGRFRVRLPLAEADVIAAEAASHHAAPPPAFDLRAGV
jgi:two-component system, NtrC family, sensor histidine kinase GlrK